MGGVIFAVPISERAYDQAIEQLPGEVKLSWSAVFADLKIGDPAKRQFQSAGALKRYLSLFSQVVRPEVSMDTLFGWDEGERADQDESPSRAKRNVSVYVSNCVRKMKESLSVMSKASCVPTSGSYTDAVNQFCSFQMVRKADGKQGKPIQVKVTVEETGFVYFSLLRDGMSFPFAKRKYQQDEAKPVYGEDDLAKAMIKTLASI